MFINLFSKQVHTCIVNNIEIISVDPELGLHLKKISLRILEAFAVISLCMLLYVISTFIMDK